jgi:hypothetical protein
MIKMVSFSNSGGLESPDMAVIPVLLDSVAVEASQYVIVVLVLIRKKTGVSPALPICPNMKLFVVQFNCMMQVCY